MRDHLHAKTVMAAGRSFTVGDNITIDETRFCKKKIPNWDTIYKYLFILRNLVLIFVFIIQLNINKVQVLIK